MKWDWKNILLTPLHLFYWNLFFIILNMALVIYIPYKFFYFSSLPKISDVEIIVAIALLCLQIAEISVKLHTSSDMLGTSLKNKEIIRKNYLVRQLPFDILSLIAIISLCLPDDWTPALRLLIYCKLPSIFKYDMHITIAIKSNFFNFWYILIKVLFFYLVYCNMVSGIFFKIDYNFYLQQGYYVDYGMIWLMDSPAMPDLIDWSAPVQYLYALYWSAITSSTTGYGDLTALNPPEVLLTLFCFVPNILLFGFLIDSINFKFSELNEKQETTRDQETVVLRVLRDAKVSKRTFYQFKFHLHKMVDRQIKNRQNIMESLSANLQMELIKQLFSEPLQKFNDLSRDDLLTIRTNIEEVAFFHDEIVDPSDNYYYIAEGRGEIRLGGLDYCSYEEGVATINQYYSKSSLNMYSFFTRHSNRFLTYKASIYTKAYCINQPINIPSLRAKQKQIKIDRQYSKYGIQCNICYSIKHPTVECYYLTFMTIDSNIITRSKKVENEGQGNKRQFQHRHSRQNLIVRNMERFKRIQFQELYMKI